MENSELKEKLKNEIEKNVILENSLKEKDKNLQIFSSNIGNNLENAKEIVNIKNINKELEKRIDYFQKRERDLLNTLTKIKNNN